MSDRGQSVKRLERDRALTHDPDKLRGRRFAAELTIRGLSRESKVSTGTISSLERGLYSSELLTLQKLAKALGCKVADLLPDRASGGTAA